MKILLTNDDGIEAEGLEVLARIASRFGEIYCIAPAGPASGCSHRVTAHDPVRIADHGPNRHSITGFPADCVRVALRHMNWKPDWIFSGVNHGGNLGVDIFLSGTVAAVREGAIFGIPGIAFSHYRSKDRDFDWQRVERVAPSVVEHILKQKRQGGEYWSVNFPHLLPGEADPPIVECRVDMTPMAFAWKRKELDLDYISNYHERPRTPGGDVAACFGGAIAVARLGLP